MEAAVLQAMGFGCGDSKLVAGRKDLFFFENER